MKRLPGIYTINIIDSLPSQDIKDLLSISIGENKVTFKELLEGRYGHLYSLYSREGEIKARAALIFENCRLFIERIKKIEQYIETLVDPESFISQIVTEGKGEKNTGVHSESYTDSESVSSAHNKNRGGSSAYGKEHQIQKLGDLEDEELINTVKGLGGKNRKEGEFDKDGKVVEKKKASEALPSAGTGPGGVPAVPPPEAAGTKPEIPLIAEASLTYEAPTLHTIDEGTSRGITVTNGNVFSAGGREIKSNSAQEATIKKFVKGKSIDYLQKTTLINYRDKIINQFQVLFTNLPCH